MPTGRPDWYDQVVLVGSDITVPISIQASSVVIDVNITSAVTLDVNITGSTVTIDVNITGSSVTLDVNITGSVTLDVNIKSQSVTIDVNIKSQEITLNVNITGSTVTIDVNIKSQDVDLNVNIKSQSVTLNVQVQGQASVSIDNASVYLNVKQDFDFGYQQVFESFEPGSGDSDLDIYTDKWGLFFPRGCRGVINRIEISVKNTTGAGYNVNCTISIAPGYPPLITKQIWVPATLTSYGWRGQVLNQFWPYESMYVEISSPVSGIYLEGKTSAFGAGGYKNVAPQNIQPGMKLAIMDKKAGEVSISGTVNTINIPNRTTKVTFSGTTSADTWVELINEAFIGKIKKIVLKTGEWTNVSASKVRITIDDNVVFEDTLVNLAAHGFAKIKYISKYGSLIEFNNELAVNQYTKIECYLENFYWLNPEINVTMYYESLR